MLSMAAYQCVFVHIPHSSSTYKCSSAGKRLLSLLVMCVHFPFIAELLSNYPFQLPRIYFSSKLINQLCGGPTSLEEAPIIS